MGGVGGLWMAHVLVWAPEIKCSYMISISFGGCSGESVNDFYFFWLLLYSFNYGLLLNYTVCIHTLISMYQNI